MASGLINRYDSGYGGIPPNVGRSNDAGERP